MAARRPVRRCRPKVPPSVMVPRRFSLREARLEALPPAERAEFVRLVAQGWGQPRVYNLLGPSDPEHRRYDELLEGSETALRNNLISGAWLATGRDPLQP